MSSDTLNRLESLIKWSREALAVSNLELFTAYQNELRYLILSK